MPPFLVVCRPLVLDVEESVEAALLFISHPFMHLQECEVYYLKLSQQQKLLKLASKRKPNLKQGRGKNRAGKKQGIELLFLRSFKKTEAA